MTPDAESDQGLLVAGFVLAGASLITPPAVVAALVVGALATARGRILAGATIMWMAAVLAMVGGLIWYDALDLSELLFYPDEPRPIPFPGPVFR